MPHNNGKVRNVMNYLAFGSPYKSIFAFFAKGDAKREEEIIYQTTKITHLIVFSIVAMLIISAVVLSLIEKTVHLDENIGLAIFGIYFGCFIFIAMGSLLPIIIHWRVWSRKSKEGLYINHCIQNILFGFPALLAFFVARSGMNWFVILPIFTLVVLLLWLTFPTRRKWEKWIYGS